MPDADMHTPVQRGLGNRTLPSMAAGKKNDSRCSPRSGILWFIRHPSESWNDELDEIQNCSEVHSLDQCDRDDRAIE
jgi:hypothetical protein